MPKRRLGKGLEAIIRNTNFLEIEGEKDELIRLPVNSIQPNRFQPRKEFGEEDIRELAESIKEKGIVQPLVVRRSEGGYELVIGERRLRAAKVLGLEKVPCVLVEIEDRELLEIALVENLQREDLNPIEEGMAYRTLMDRFGMSQSDVAEKVGKKRSTVANTVRLLKLPEKIKEYIVQGKLTGGHARALLAVDGDDERISMAEKILRDNLSVRVVEVEAREKTAGREKGVAAKPKFAEDRRLAALEEAFQSNLGTMVRIRMRPDGRGRLEIHFYSEEDLSRLCEALGVQI
ncbi:MAG: ParB/RepB/Spo0J family partition protein [Candidatus Glassbacteria bacterium]